LGSNRYFAVAGVLVALDLGIATGVTRVKFMISNSGPGSNGTVSAATDRDPQT